MTGPIVPTPLIETAPAEGEGRLLLISCLFPPSTLVGALRWEEMVRFALAHGWTADVISLPFTEATATGRERFERVGAGLRVYGVREPTTLIERLNEWRARRSDMTPRRRAVVAAEIRAGEARNPSPASRALAAAKGHLYAHDYYRKWRRWARDVADVGTRLAAGTPYALLASSGPPHMAHEAGRLIARRTGLPLLIDFRDPWTSRDTVLPGLREDTWISLSERYEQRCVDTSARIVMNTEPAAEFMRRKYPRVADRVLAIPNGADGSVRPTSVRPRPFTVSYTGSLYGGRRVQALFRAVRLAATRCTASPDDFRLQIMGVDDEQLAELLALAGDEGIDPWFQCDTRRPHQEALALLDRSAMLVVLPQVHTLSVPAKLYEYVQRPAWILALTEQGTATFDALKDTAADVVEPDDIEHIAAAIATHFREWRAGAAPAPLNTDGRFSRERQAERMLAALNAIRRDSRSR